MPSWAKVEWVQRKHYTSSYINPEKQNCQSKAYYDWQTPFNMKPQAVRRKSKDNLLVNSISILYVATDNTQV
jgi:hypothetical protein